MSMFDFNQDVEKISKEIRTSAQTQKAVSETLFSSAHAEANVEIEGAKLADANQVSDELNENIVNLIMGLDETTQSFGKQFDTMQSKTFGESFVGFFSKNKSDSMRAERIQSSSIAENLQDLITKTESIDTLLNEHLDVLNTEHTKGISNLEYVVNDAQETTIELEAAREKMQELDPKLMAAERELENATDAKERARVESELMELNNQFNESKNAESRLLAKSQSRERHIKTNQTHIDSLANQITAQEVLIEKLRIDNEQRVITYAQYEQSIKTAEQQEVAHQINEIGSEVDLRAQAGMASIGAASSNRLADMLERHGSDVTRQNEIHEKKRKADDRFMRRFKEVAEQHDSAQYTQGL